MKKVKLDELVQINIGKTPSRSNKLFWNGSYNWLAISDMKEKYLSFTKETITQNAVEKCNMKLVKKGTVVMSFKLSIGKLGILSQDMYTNEAIANFQIIDPRILRTGFLYYALQSLDFDAMTDRAVMGKTLNKTKLSRIEIKYYDPESQKVIEKRLDTISLLINLRKVQLTELDNLVKSRFNEMFGDVISNPKGHPLKQLSDIFVLKSGTTTSSKEISVKQDNQYIYPCYGGNGVRGFVKYFNHDGEFPLIGRQGALCGNVNFARGKFHATEHAVLVTPIIKINILWSYYALTYLDLYRFHTGAAQPGLSVTKLNEVKLPLPPLSLQNEFAAFVEEVDKSKFIMGIFQKTLEKCRKIQYNRLILYDEKERAMGNFDFLLKDKDYHAFAQACIEAERSFALSTIITAYSSRRALELAVKWMYQFDQELKIPYKDNLSTLIHTTDFQEIVEPKLIKQMELLIRYGNVAIHSNTVVSETEAILCLNTLFQFVLFIDYCYGEQYIERQFDENLLPISAEIRTRESQKAIEEMTAKVPEDKPLQELRDAANLETLQEFTEKRLSAPERQEEMLKLDLLSETETRERFIDVDLRLAGWVLGKNYQIEVPVKGLKNPSNKGYVDYVLYGRNNLPLAVVEAKKATVNPEVGSQQAKEYADALALETGQRPVIFCTNGFETLIWEEDYPRRQVAGFYSQDELQLIIDRRQLRTPLTDVASLINDDISNRYYQKEAIIRTCEAFEANRRRALLVMATGSGKTRTAVSLVDILSKKNWIKNVLFLADRTSLVRQAYRSFNKLLPNLSLCNLLEHPEIAHTSRMIFSTYPTMLNAIDGLKNDLQNKLFTVGHFDLIIIDESHRSIYDKYQTIFNYFDAKVVGLTATPRDDVDKSTYNFFNLDSGNPTYAYDLEQAVTDGYLVSYQSVETQLKLPTDGLHYDELSEEDKLQFENQFEDEGEIRDIDGNEFNQHIFNKPTVEIVLKELMEKGIRTASGDEIGKTILFAKNHRHAEFIKKTFDLLYPEKGDHYAKVIDYSIKHYQQLIDEFSTKTKLPQIAISVDMLDTGIDVPEVVNLVFFKKVRSKIKFWQMIGRGTRLCKDLFGPDLDKELFVIFDYGNNFEYFRENSQLGQGQSITPLTQRLYNLRVELIRELQESSFQDDFHQVYREQLITQITSKLQALDNEDFRVRMALKYVMLYRDRKNWNHISVVQLSDIKEQITPLILPDKDDELAKRFDAWIYFIELATLINSNATPHIKQVIQTAQALKGLTTIPQVSEQITIINQVQEEEFWKEVSLRQLEKIRTALRDLLQFIDKDTKKSYYTNFDDEILSTVEDQPALLNVNDLRSYKERVEFYLKAHLEQPAVHKLYHNEELNAKDIRELQNILWNQLGTKAEYEKNFASKSVSRLVRETIGLDRNAVNEAFSTFLSDNNLNSNQIEFVKLIIEYISKNGYLDKTQLQKTPFKNFGSLVQLFEYNKPVLQSIIFTIDQINARAEQHAY